METTDALRKIATLAMVTDGDPLEMSDALARIEREARHALFATRADADDGPDPAEMESKMLRHLINYERQEGRAFGYTAEKCRHELARRGEQA